MHHSPTNVPLGGALRGVLPNPTLFVEDNSLALAQQVFARRTLSPGSAGATSTSSVAVSHDEIRAFERRPVQVPELRAGSNVTLTRDAGGITIAAAAGGGASMDEIIALLPHRTQREIIQAGLNVSLRRNALGPIIDMSGGGVGVPVLDLVENKDFAVAGTSYTFNNLDGDTDEVYLLVYRIIKNVVAFAQTSLRPNGITTNQQSYDSWFGSFSGTGNTTTLLIQSNGTAAVGGVEAGHMWIHAKTGVSRSISGLRNLWDAGGPTNLTSLIAGRWTDTTTNITSLEVVCDQANGIGAGSYLRLYKLRKAKSASGNFVEKTVALDGNLVFTETVTGQSWVSASSKLVASLMAVAVGGTTAEQVKASGVIVGTSNIVAGVGFDVWAYNPNGMVGTITVHITGN